MTPPDRPEGAVAWRMLAEEARRRLEASGVVADGSAPAEARWIVERASGNEGPEYALGLEALDRLAEGEPLWRVHEALFGVLALESEPVDPRL